MLKSVIIIPGLYLISEFKKLIKDRLSNFRTHFYEKVFSIKFWKCSLSAQELPKCSFKGILLSNLPMGDNLFKGGRYSLLEDLIKILSCTKPIHTRNSNIANLRLLNFYITLSRQFF